MKRNFEIGRQPSNTKLGERRVHTVRCRGGFIKFRALRLDHGNYCWPGEAVTKKTRILGVVYNATSNELVRTNTLVKGSIVQIDATPFKNWYKRHYGVVIGRTKTAGAKRQTKGAEKGKVVKKAKTEEKGKKDEKKKEEKKETKPETKKAEPKKAETKKPEVKKAEAKKPEAKKPEAKKPEAKKAPVAVDTKKTEVKRTEKKSAKSDKKAGKMQVEGKTEKKRPPITKKGKLIKKRRRPTSSTMLRKWRLRNKSRVLETTLADQFTKGRLYAKISSRPGQVGHADGYILEGDELAFYVKKLNLKKKK